MFLALMGYRPHQSLFGHLVLLAPSYDLARRVNDGVTAVHEWGLAEAHITLGDAEVHLPAFGLGPVLGGRDLAFVREQDLADADIRDRPLPPYRGPVHLAIAPSGNGWLTEQAHNGVVTVAFPVLGCLGQGTPGPDVPT